MNVNFKVAENAKKFISIAVVIVLVCLSCVVIRGFNFGIDFLGGTILHLDIHKEFTTEEISQVIKDMEQKNILKD